jgi:hypothetical protein
VVALAEIDSQQQNLDIATQPALGYSSSLGPPRVVALSEFVYFDFATQPAPWWSLQRPARSSCTSTLPISQPWGTPPRSGLLAVAIAEFGSQQMYFDIATQPALGPSSSAWTKMCEERI